MDTSDSECFESADEEFDSDTEEKLVKAKVPSGSAKDVTGKLKLKELTINETDNVNKEVHPPTTNKISDDDLSNNMKKDDAKPKPSNVTADKSEKRSSKPMKPKLGVKLGTKINASSCKPRTSEDVEKKEIKSKLQDNLSKCQKDDDKSKANKGSNDDSSKNIKNEENLLKLDKSNKEEVTLDDETNMWTDNDDWEPVSSANRQSTSKHVKEDFQSNKTIKNTQNDSNSGWGGWGSWNVTSILSTATMGVTTITNHVSQGLTTVIESGIGAPPPEMLGTLHRSGKLEKMEESTEMKEEKEDEERKTSRGGVPDLTGFGLGTFVSSVSQITKLVETTGNKVITSGLDTLETIGKKTMEVLQEGDPGLKKKRAFLTIDSDKSVLSHILREAKEKAEEENRLAEEKHISKKANYETLFDDHQGLAHLEALEMLSRQCDIKLNTLLGSQSGADLIEMQETLNQIKELCEITDEDEDENEELNESEIKEKLDTAVSELNIPISYNKLFSTWKDIDEWLENLDLNVYKATQLHEESINILAQLTAVAVELFHKTGELLLIKEHRSTVDEADSLVQLTTTMTTLISNIAKKASNKLNEKASHSGNKDNINQYITNVYFEATNSSTYIKDAFELLIPVLQVGAV